MSKTHIATFILHSISLFFIYVSLLQIAQFSAAKVNNKKKCVCVCGGGGGEGGGGGGRRR